MESDAERLVLENMRLVNYFIKRQPVPSWMNYDEYYSEMLIALWNAARKYIPELSAFSSYALQGMRLKAQMLREHNSTVKVSKFKRTIYLPDGNPMAIAAPEVRCSAFDSIDQHLVSELTRHLTSPHREIIQWRMEGLSFREIAVLTGCKSHQSVNCRYRSALRIMRRIAKLNGITAQSAGL